MKSFAIAAAALVATALNAGSVQAQDDFSWPRMLVVGTPGTTTGSFASTNGWGPVMEKQTGMSVRIVPEDNEMVRLQRLTAKKNIHVSSTSSAELRSQLEGIGAYSAVPAQPVYILWHHNDTPWGYVTSGNSGLTSLKDLAKGGYRISTGVFSPTLVTSVKTGLPAFAGLTPEEAEDKFIFVPASSYAESCRAVVEGRADIALCATISSLLSEMEAAPGGIRWLPMESADTDGWKGYGNARPMVVPGKISMGVQSAIGVEGSTSNFLYMVPADADEDFAYHMAKWFAESYDDYKSTHPLAARMSVEQFRHYLNSSPIPVHPGTVRCLKEIGLWDEEDDAWNKEAVARMDAWVAARNAALKEAMSQGIRPAPDDAAFLAILKKHTADLEGFRVRL